MTNATDKVMGLISKLLQVQEGRGATEAEAAQAAEHVQRLLGEHNLTLSEVEAKGGASDGGKRSKEQTELSAAGEWHQILMRSVAEGNFCLHKVIKPTVGQVNRRFHVLVGRDVNVRASKELYGYLVSTVTRLLYDGGRKMTTEEGRAWLQGCVDRLAHRLHVRMEERQREDQERQNAARAKGDASRALVLADVYGTESERNNDMLNGWPDGTTTARRQAHAAREAEREKKEAELVAQGVDKTEAFYLSHGYTAEAAKAYTVQYKRGAGRSRGGRGYSMRFSKADRRRQTSDYQAGRTAGAGIGLDPQAGHAKTPRLGGKQ